MHLQPTAFLGSVVTFRTENIAAENPMYKATILRDLANTFL